MLGNIFEKRNTLSYQTLFNLGGDIVQQTSAGVVVTDDRALGLTGIYSAISLTADTLATLPCLAYVQDATGYSVPLEPQPDWVLKPDIDLSRVSFWQSFLISTLWTGHGFSRIYRDENDNIIGLAVLNPLDVKMRRSVGGRIEYHYKNKPVPARDMVSVPYFLKPGEIRGTSPIKQLAQNIGLAIALETFTARFFGSGANVGLVLRTDGELSQEQVDDLARQVENKHAGLNTSHRPMVLQGGLRAENTTQANDSNQLIESRKFAIEDIARIYNTPPHLLGLPGYNSYASVEEANLQWISHQLRPLATKLESAFSELLPPGQFLKFDFKALERGNIQARAEAYTKFTTAGVMSIDDVRGEEGWALIGGEAAELPRVPLANIDINAAGLAELEKKVAIVVKLIQQGFDPEAAAKAYDLPYVPHDGGIPVTLQMEQE